MRARDAAIADERHHRAEGAADARLAGRGEGQIDFDRMSRDGDYAVAVRQQLQQLLDRL